MSGLIESGLVLLFVLLGITGRFLLDKIFAVPEKATFPWTTFLVNILGCSFISLIYVLIKREFPQVVLYPVWLLSFSIGFTLFSAYAIHTMRAYEKTRSIAALIYFLISPSLGILVAYATLIAVKRWS
jgi:fluoride exporter